MVVKTLGAPMRPTRRRAAAGFARSRRRPTPHRFPPRLRPDHPFDRLPPAGAQDPGVRLPRGRPLPHPAHPYPGSAQIARSLARALGLDEDLSRGAGARPRSRPSAVRPCRRARARPLPRRRRRLRPQRPDAARRDRARAALRRLRRAQPHLGNAGRPGQAQRPADRLATGNRSGATASAACRRRSLDYDHLQDLELWSFASAEAQVAAHRRRHRLRRPRHRRRAARRPVRARRSRGRRVPPATSCASIRQQHRGDRARARRPRVGAPPDHPADRGRDRARPRARLERLAPSLRRRRAPCRSAGRRVLGGDGGGRPARSRGSSIRACTAITASCASWARRRPCCRSVLALRRASGRPAGGLVARRRGQRRRRPLRRIGDFIAGMTDRYALVEHARLFPSHAGAACRLAPSTGLSICIPMSIRR